MKKIICILICMLFFTIIYTSITTATSTTVNKKSEQSNSFSNGDSWVRITKPLDGSKATRPIEIEAEGSDDIDFVMYGIFYDEIGYSSHLWIAHEPPYHFELDNSDLTFFGIRLRPGDKLQIYAAAWNDTQGLLAVSEIIEVSVKIKLLKNPLECIGTKFPELFKLLSIQKNNIFFLYVINVA